MRYEQVQLIFEDLKETYLQDLYDLKVEKVKIDELDCFCYSLIAACIFKYQSSHQAKINAGYLTEIMWEKYQPKITARLKDRSTCYQKYLSLYFAHKKTTNGLDPAMAMGVILLGFVVEKMSFHHVYAVEMTTTIHKMILAAIDKIQKNNRIPPHHAQIRWVQ